MEVILSSPPSQCQISVHVFLIGPDLEINEIIGKGLATDRSNHSDFEAVYQCEEHSLASLNFRLHQGDTHSLNTTIFHHSHAPFFAIYVIVYNPLGMPEASYAQLLRFIRQTEELGHPFLLVACQWPWLSSLVSDSRDSPWIAPSSPIMASTGMILLDDTRDEYLRLQHKIVKLTTESYALEINRDILQIKESQLLDVRHSPVELSRHFVEEHLTRVRCQRILHPSVSAESLHYQWSNDLDLESLSISRSISRLSSESISSQSLSLSQSSSASSLIVDPIPKEFVTNYQILQDEPFSCSNSNSLEMPKQLDAVDDVDTSELSKYTDRYQAILQYFQESIRLSAALDSPERDKAIEDLATLNSDFCSLVTIYTRVIISELHLPPEKKTLQPLSIVHSEPYLLYFKNNILFKVGVDMNESFGSNDSDHIAGKMLAHELKGSETYRTCNHSGLHFPLMVMVVYMGYRILCTSYSNLSLDAWCAQLTGDRDELWRLDQGCQELLKQTAVQLNFASHQVDAELRAYSASDLRLIRDQNSRLFLLDSAHALPPTACSAGSKHLYRRFRSEFVRKYPKPLCPDAFSKYMGHDLDDECFHQDINNATQWLEESVIPQVAIKIGTDITLEIFEKVAPRLAYLLHRDGINLRYLGKVFACLKFQYPMAAFMVLIEILARSIKNQIQQAVRATLKIYQVHAETTLRFTIVKLLNRLFGSKEHPVSIKSWHILMDGASNWFFLSQKDVIDFFDEHQIADTWPFASAILNYRLAASRGGKHLFSRMVELSRVRLHKYAFYDFMETYGSSSATTLRIADILHQKPAFILPPSLAMGAPLYSLATYRQNMYNPTMIKSLRKAATLLFALSARTPTNPDILYHLAVCLSLCLSIHLPPLNHPDFWIAEDLFQSAIGLWPPTQAKRLANCHHHYANLLMLRGDIRHAHDHFLQALEQDPFNLQYLRLYIQFLITYHPEQLALIDQFTQRVQSLKALVSTPPLYLPFMIHPFKLSQDYDFRSMRSLSTSIESQ